MFTKSGRPSDEVWSAPESGTIRDDTSGNQPAHPQERGTPATETTNPHGGQAPEQNKDDPCFAGEAR